jgi:pimeloyl-ACP methyl ester carboxylesterase
MSSEPSEPSSEPSPELLDFGSWGAEGPRVLLVHGSLVDGPKTWLRQRDLGLRWSVDVVQRRGFGASPPSTGDDFEQDALDLLALIGDRPAHLVGHSYGAIACLSAAIREPSSVASLTLVEPTCVGVVDDPRVRAAVDVIRAWWRDRPADPQDFLAGYAGLLGIRVPRIDGAGPGAEALRRAVTLLRECREPWGAEGSALACERVREAGVPTLVITGGHSAPLDAVGAAVAARTGGRHEVLEGAGHAVQMLGTPFNDTLEAHLAAEPARR